LYEYDGTNPPVLVADIWSGSNGSGPAFLTAFNNKLYFQANNGITGEELWVYNGINSPSLVADIFSGASGSNPMYLVVFNNKLFFSAGTETAGTELWSYDGENLPGIVADTIPGWESLSPTYLTAYNDRLFFRGFDSVNGYELWNYNPAELPTLVADVWPGSESSSIMNLFAFQNKLYFQANDGLHGDELWVYDGNASGQKDVLIGSYPGQGIWEFEFEQGNWTKYSNMEAKEIRSGDINGNGVNDLAVWLKHKNELWYRFDNGTWQKQAVSIDSLICFDLKDINGDEKADFIGSYSTGLWWRDAHTLAWKQFSKQQPKQIESAELGNGNLNDLLLVFADSIWIRYSDTNTWQKQAINVNDLIKIKVGDLNGDGQTDIAGSWNFGVWWRDAATAVWHKLHKDPAAIIETGHFDSDQKDDLAGIWNIYSGTWIRYSSDGSWENISKMKADCLAAGRWH
jgi:ELWxxDGT repeat protein